ncbi:MAG: adenine deaminase [Erysipelotrichaceae bacterium]|nr:adenine deaminase [Erysipelotrichaceae bacterium]
MKLQVKNRKEFLKAARGEKLSDLALVNGKIVNVFNGEIKMGTVYVSQGFICHVDYHDEAVEAKEIIDVQGKYVVPGFIDSHVHIESSMLTPRNFAKAVLPWGTTTVITDPHEIGNVWGVEGVRYMHEISKDLPMRQLIDVPSCVPSVPNLENAGADFLADTIEELSQLERVVGLAEVMDYLAVIYGEERMMDIINAAEKKGIYIQGHGPGLTGRMLSAYLCAGPSTCHETHDPKEAYEKLAQGMFLDTANSSIATNFDGVWEGVKNSRYFDHVCLCTDDRESDDILTSGHINGGIRIMIEKGMHPVDAIRAATYNSAQAIHMEHLGAVAPGYAADIVVLEDLKEVRPSMVFFEGRKVAENGHLCVEIEERHHEIEEKNSVCIRNLTVDDFIIKTPVTNGKVKANIMQYESQESAFSELKQKEFHVVDGIIQLDDPDLKFVAVVNRYPNHDNIALQIVRGFGMSTGALASTVSHDCHNLTIVYDTPENALIAANEIKRVYGGMTAVKDGRVLHTLALPVAGLLSNKPAEELALDARKMKEANRELGMTSFDNPLLRIVTLALPVIPNVKMSDLGLVDVIKKQLIPMFEIDEKAIDSLNM